MYRDINTILDNMCGDTVIDMSRNKLTPPAVRPTLTYRELMARDAKVAAAKKQYKKSKRKLTNAQPPRSN